MATPKTLADILAIEDINVKIKYLKAGRRTPLPDTERNRKDWEPKLHDIMDQEKYKKIRVLVEMEKTKTYQDANGEVHTTTEPAKYEMKEPNRVALPIEQDIVNIQTSFTVGIEPSLTCTPDGDGEEGVFAALKRIMKRCKLKYQNRRIVRAWLSEQDIVEYWYVVQDLGFWQRLKNKIRSLAGMKVMPQYRLACQLWSPFLGDTIYPFFDESGNYLACSREYKVKDLEGKEHLCFQCATTESVFVWEMGNDGWVLNTEQSIAKHNLGGCPAMYAYRPESYTAKIRPLRERLEKCLSGYADCIDNHFFPLLMLFGDIEPNVMGSDVRRRMMQLTGEGADARYLTWNQSSDPIKVEIETYLNGCYSMTDTPRITLDQLKGIGNALSGTAFRYFFMGAHMAVANHGEVLGEFFQRRVNFLIRAIGSLNASLTSASETIEVETEIQPFIIDSKDDKVKTAVAAVSGGVWSTEAGVAYCNDYGEMKDELERIAEGQERKNKGDVTENNDEDDQ